MKQIIVIPARMGSKRLNNKPMINLKGKTMIERTFLQCAKALDKKLIYVATDSLIILNHCKKKNMNCILTTKNCLTGTDRVAEVAKKVIADSYINVQGDEPFFNPLDIKKLIKFSKKYKNEVINGYCELKEKKNFINLNIPKVVFDEKKNLLYMSRSAIPGSKQKKYNKSYRQICAYVFPRDKLLKFSKRKIKTQFEALEDIEILRFLEMGIKVKMLELSSDSISVDIKSDISKVCKKLK